jgi:hypothetical protein
MNGNQRRKAMKLLNIVGILLTATGCASTKQVEVCPTTYDPHLCLMAVDGAIYEEYGSNKCKTLNKLKLKMKINAIGAVVCDRVLTDSEQK